MRTVRVIQTALNALRRNPMRAALTTLGIIIGIGAVIAMMEIGNGSSQAIQKTIARLGANMLLVLPGAVNSGGISFGSGTGMTLTPMDADAILRECPEVAYAAPLVRFRSQVICGNRNTLPIYMWGTTPGYLNVRNWTNMAEGSPFTDADVRNVSKVCLIGQTVARRLFDDDSPIGRDIRVQNVTLKVVGVLAPKGANMSGTDQDDILLAPWTTVKFRVSAQSVQIGSPVTAATTINTLNKPYPSSGLSLFDAQSPDEQFDRQLPIRFINVDLILMAATGAKDMKMASREATALLRERHHLQSDQEDDFEVRNMAEAMKAQTSNSAVMVRLLLAVACISLVVGGVGIMNIMLVSVTERTREIGLRMAVGARGQDILNQFLVEAVLLCLAGGILGVSAGVGVSWLVHTLLQWPTASSPGAVIVAFLVSAAVGVIFGFYPAWKASKLDPIDALRYE